MTTKQQVTLRFRDEYMRASKKDRGRILDEMCSVLTIGVFRQVGVSCLVMYFFRV